MMEKLNITDTILENLGFSEYDDENGDSGGRTLTFKNGTRFRILEVCEKDDDSDGYDSDGKYIANHYCFIGYFALPQMKIGLEYDLFFLHEMYECIEKEYPTCLEEFTAKCKEFKMYYYIEEYKNKK